MDRRTERSLWRPEISIMYKAVVPGNFTRVCVSVLVSSIKFPRSLSLHKFSSSFKVCSRRHLILHQNDFLHFLELSFLCLFRLLLLTRSETKASILSGDDAFCGLCMRDDCILSYTAHLSSHNYVVNSTWPKLQPIVYQQSHNQLRFNRSLVTQTCKPHYTRSWLVFSPIAQIKKNKHIKITCTWHVDTRWCTQNW